MNKIKPMIHRICRDSSMMLGVIGLTVFILAIIVSDPSTKNMLTVIATLFLATSAWLQLEAFFMGLETIALISALLVFYDIPSWINTILFIVLATIFSALYFSYNRITLVKAIGFCGLVFLCLGILTSSNFPMFIAGSLLSVYSVFSIREGYSVGWIFFVLNVLFALTAGISLFF